MDGQQLNQRMGFGYMKGMTSPLMGDLDHIEITHGPGALTQGSGAINGFINMVPKNGKDNPGVFFNIETGVKEKSKVMESRYGFSYGQENNLFLYAGAYHADGFEPKNVFDHESVYPINAFGTGDTGYRFSSYWKHQGLDLNAFYFENNPVTGSALTGLAYSEGSWHTATAGLRPRFELNLTSKQSISFIGSFLWVDFKLIYKTTTAENNIFALGTSYGHKKFSEKNQFFEDDLLFQAAAQNTSWREVSLFAEDRITINTALSLTLGLRYDKYIMSEISGERMPMAFKPEIEGHFFPLLSFAYEIKENSILKLSYKHGYRVPDVVHYRFSSISNRAAESLGLTAHNLKPEIVNNYELNLHSQLSENSYFYFNLFHNEFEKQLSFGPLSNVWGSNSVAVITAGGNANGMVQNLADEEYSDGGELVLVWEFLPNSVLQGSYSYSNVGDRLPQRVPLNIFKIGISGKFISEKFHYSFNYLFSSDMSNVGNPSADQWHASYKQQEHLVNLSLDFDLSESTNLYLRAHNLFEDNRPVMTFNTSRPNLGYLGSEERRIYLGLRTRF